MQSCLMLVYATTSVLFYRLSLCNITLGKKKKSIVKVMYVARFMV